MSDNLPTTFIEHNTHSSFLSVSDSHNKLKKLLTDQSTRSIYSSRRFYDQKKFLLPVEFKAANNQKRMWVAAVIQECGLRGNECFVIEALAFLTDPVYGNGEPTIGAIQEQVQKKVASIHRDTITQCLKRLQQKGAIIYAQRGKKQSNFYTLVGYEYKSESCYRDSLHSLNSALSPKKEREQQSYKRGKKINKKKIEVAKPSAQTIIEPSVHEASPVNDDDLAKGKSYLAKMRSDLWKQH